MTPEGTDRVDLTPDASGYDGRWAPDGSRIAFESRRNGVSEVFVMNADGSDPRRLAAGSDPAWSPDGRRIVFVAGSSLAIMNSDGSDPSPLTGPRGGGTGVVARWGHNRLLGGEPVSLRPAPHLRRGLCLGYLRHRAGRQREAATDSRHQRPVLGQLAGLVARWHSHRLLEGPRGVRGHGWGPVRHGRRRLGPDPARRGAGQDRGIPGLGPRRPDPRLRHGTQGQLLVRRRPAAARRRGAGHRHDQPREQVPTSWR